MVLDAPTGVNTATPQKVVDTKVEGDLNATAVQANGVSGSIHTDVKGTGNMTIVTVNNNYNSVHSTSAGTPAKKTTTTDKPQKKPKNSPTEKKEEPKKSPETKPADKPASEQQAPISARETAQRAEQLAKASNDTGTKEEEFYNAVTTVPGGETAESVKTNNTQTMDQRVFLSKENMTKLDKYLKTHQLVSTSMSAAGGIRSYIQAEFDIKDRNDFYNNKMRELTNLLDKYGIK